MIRDRSFKGYVADRFYNEFCDAISDFIGDDINRIGLRLSHVRSVGSWEISDLEVKYVTVNDLPGMEIQFDAIVDAEFYVREADYHYDRDEEAHQWFLVGCIGDLERDLDDMQITSTMLYNQRNKPPAPLSDALVPIIHKDQMEDAAADFLRRNYPEALRSPMPIDPIDLAGKMGLSVEMRQISKDFSAFGQIFFCDAVTDVYDAATDSTVPTEVTGKTIVVDPQNFFLRNLGSVNNTIIHECVHWDKHRKAFQLERLYNKAATQIQCQVAGGILDGNAKSATDWMEWQANTLAPKIQMPLIPFKMKAYELIGKYRRELHTNELVDVLEPVIDELAEFYVVSRLAAKIRLIDAGYNEAIGVYEYVDGGYVKPHCFRKNSIRRDQTYSISFRDALLQSVFSPEFLEKLKSGNYLFVDSHICLNHPKYIRRDENGEVELTWYARHHMDECCLIFDLTIESGNAYGKQFFKECVLYRGASPNVFFEPHYSDDNLDDAAKAKLLKDYNDEILAVSMRLPMSFSGALDELIKWTGMTEEKLADEADLSEKTIQRLRTTEPDNVTMETIMQLCIGMHLPPMLSDCLMKAAKTDFKQTPQHMMYRFLINGYYIYSLDECNAKLIEQDCKPLGRKKK